MKTAGIHHQQIYTKKQNQHKNKKLNAEENTSGRRKTFPTEENNSREKDGNGE